MTPGVTFDLQKLFMAVFAPVPGDRVTIMSDLPNGTVKDNAAWRERRDMAADWRARIAAFAGGHGFSVSPLYSYEATGVWAGELPVTGWLGQEPATLSDVVGDATIIISMAEFSVTPSLVTLTQKHPHLRAASMPLVARSMERTALAADYDLVARNCAAIAERFDRAIGVDVQFSTGHSCYFDLSDRKPARQDNGRLHPGASDVRMRNLPSGEVYVVPREDEQSLTAGMLPVAYGEETAVFVVRRNRIMDVQGSGLQAARMRHAFSAEPALANIAEVAIGCNDRAVVWGNILEDEKAGFHWAYGRSDFIGGTVGIAAFSSIGTATHRDIVYAKESRISCAALDFVLPAGEREAAIRNGELVLQVAPA